MDVSIIVVAWNGRDLLRACLESVYAQTRDLHFEVIYVDNGSDDGSVGMVRREFPDVRIIENKENRGFTVANNQAIETVESRYVLLLNNDTIIQDDAIMKTVDFADSHPEAAVVGCRVLNPDRTLQRSCFLYPSLLNSFLAATYLYKMFPRSRFFGRERMGWFEFDEVREVATVAGCYSLVRTEAIDQVGLMDDAYFFYGDDPDWCYRFRQSGWRIMFTPEPEIIHYGGQSTKDVAEDFTHNDKLLLHLYGAKLLFMKQHRSALEFVFACLLQAAFFLLRAPCWLFAGLLSHRRRGPSMQRARTYFAGAIYCLVDWKKLLLDRVELGRKP